MQPRNSLPSRDVNFEQTTVARRRRPADYSPLDHLNQIFSHPSTLSSIQPTSQALRNYQYDLDEDIAEVVGQQSLSDAESVRHIQNAKQELDELFKKIEDVRDRAVRTEQAITDMTADIKRLDNTKRNLTLSMTALKRLQMLTTAYEQLRGLSKTRQYRECAQLLQAVIQLVAHFKTYRSIDQIATLSRNVADLQSELLEQICEDFEVTFAKGEVTQRRGMLAEACMVMDALGEHARTRLVNWYCNTQLREYRQVFRGNDEAGSLDNISRRYSWFNRMLKTTFSRYLDSYGQQVLFHFLGERSSVEDMILILNTADYCYSTCDQLEQKIKSKIDDEYKEKVDLQSQADAFMGIASASVRALVRKVEIDCEQGWREMRNTPWSKLESVGDQSSYVGELLRHVKERAAEILKYLHKQQYARAFCDNLIDSMVNTYILSIVQCRPVSEVGAEQMLLDSYVLKKGFTELSTINSEDPGAQPPAAFVKRVTQSMSKLDPLLKTLQVRPSPPEALVQAYLIHIADRSDTNFRKILDLKGIRKIEQAALVDLFNAHRQSPSHASLPQQSALLTPLHIGSGTPSIGSGAGSSSLGSSGPLAGLGSIGAIGNQGGRFDPATFASGIMNAARDGVDRFGSGPVGAGNVIPAMAAAERGGQGGETPTANLNENLKNIGKFFRRDVGSFGRFGRTGTGLGD
ncbi:putative garp complex subunit protein [Neofusicoccum parvum UCRNP2]|uniref:Putative garp complex subunit protein n=1 Tax=Botryosphaeria parva (strain UCR-NP2) TaxID=1287680 RepID=R1G8V7_BOTPV|nr:putative garp complex subunit protein [Neofusicoccum parvum UCRNP2]